MTRSYEANVLLVCSSNHENTVSYWGVNRWSRGESKAHGFVECRKPSQNTYCLEQLFVFLLKSLGHAFASQVRLSVTLPSSGRCIPPLMPWLTVARQ